jgi:hypothetical protein
MRPFCLLGKISRLKSLKGGTINGIVRTASAASCEE